MLVLAAMLMASNTLSAASVERDQAYRMHVRLTGVPPTNTVLDAMEQEIKANGAEAAAMIAMDNPAFYNVTLKNFVAPWTNESQSVFVPLNDYTATVIGMIRDDVPFSQVLSGDILYVGNMAGLPPYSNSDNKHYEALEKLGGDLSDPNILQRKTQSEITGLAAGATAGVITTRAAAEAFFVDGTNRAMFRFTMINHLCTDLEPLKDVSRVPDRVRQDVSRSPGGDSRIFMFNCVGCHAGMDGLSGAFARYNFDNDSQQLVYTPNAIAAKYSNNSNNFKPGHVTTDDSWINYWRNGQNQLLGWSNTPATGVQLDERGNAFGVGAKSMGAELASSEAFGRCQVKKAFQAICLHDPNNYAADRLAVNAIATDFMVRGSMKTVFAKVAAYCKESPAP